MKRIVWIALAVLVIVVAVWQIQARRRPELAQAREQEVVRAVYGLGTIVADRTYQVRPGVTTTILKLDVEEGDHVAKGNPLITLDESSVRAPFDGVVTSLPFKVGENVFPQTPVLILSDLSRLYLTVALEQRDVVKVRPGQRARISLESLRSEPVNAKVRSVYPSQNQFIVRIDASNLPAGVLPGMTADVAIQTGINPEAIVVPARAVINSEVLALRNGKKEKVRIETGARNGDWIEVTSGNLHAGETLILSKGKG